MRINGNSITPSSGSDIIIPTGYKLKGVDQGSIYSPGSIIQVQSVTKTDIFSTASVQPSFVNITGLNVSITPKFISSKILVSISVSDSQTSNALTFYRILRDSTPISLGDIAGSRTRLNWSRYPAVYTGANILTTSYITLDSPSTLSNIIYQIQAKTNSGTMRVGARADGLTGIISTFSVQEIKQ